MTGIEYKLKECTETCETKGNLDTIFVKCRRTGDSKWCCTTRNSMLGDLYSECTRFETRAGYLQN